MDENRANIAGGSVQGRSGWSTNNSGTGDQVARSGVVHKTNGRLP